MRFGFTEKQEALRKELNDFIATEMDSDWKGAVNEEYGTDEGWRQPSVYPGNWLLKACSRCRGPWSTAAAEPPAWST